MYDGGPSTGRTPVQVVTLAVPRAFFLFSPVFFQDHNTKQK